MKDQKELYGLIGLCFYWLYVQVLSSSLLWHLFNRDIKILAGLGIIRLQEVNLV